MLRRSNLKKRKEENEKNTESFKDLRELKNPLDPSQTPISPKSLPRKSSSFVGATTMSLVPGEILKESTLQVKEGDGKAINMHVSVDDSNIYLRKKPKDQNFKTIELKTSCVHPQDETTIKILHPDAIYSLSYDTKENASQWFQILQNVCNHRARDELGLLGEEDMHTPTKTKVCAWGNNEFGKLGLGAKEDQLSPVPVPIEIDAEDKILKVCCGKTTTGIVTESGNLYISGLFPVEGEMKEHHSFTLVETVSKKITQVSIGENNMAALSDIGELLFWNFQQDIGGPIYFEEFSNTNIVQVECGARHTLVLTDSATLWSWGAGNFGQLGHSNTFDYSSPAMIQALKGLIVTDISAGYQHSACVTDGGDIYVWGDGNAFGMSDTIESSPLLVSELREKTVRISRVSCGTLHTAAISDTGDIYTWGIGIQLGHGQIKDVSTPTPVYKLSKISVRSVSSGDKHLLLLSDSGHVYSCGDNSRGQGGLGHQYPASTPRQMMLENMVYSISCGFDHSIAIVEDESSYRDFLSWKLLEIVRSYLRLLKILVSVYMQPMLLESRKDEKEFGLFVGTDKVKVIFGNILTLYNSLSKVVSELDSRLTNWSPNRTIFGDLLSDIWDTYFEYYANLDIAFATFNNLTKKTSTFNEFLEYCEKKAETLRKNEQNNFNLKNLLLEPILQSRKVNEILKAMLRATPQTHPDYEPLQRNLKKVKQAQYRLRENQVSSQISKETKEINDSFRKMQYIQEWRQNSQNLVKSLKRLAETERALSQDQQMVADEILKIAREEMTSMETFSSIDYPAITSVIKHFGITLREVSAIQNEMAHKERILNDKTSKHFDEAHTTEAMNVRKKLEETLAEYNQLCSKFEDYTSVDSNKAAEKKKELDQLKESLDACKAKFLFLLEEMRSLQESKFLHFVHSYMKLQYEFFEKGHDMFLRFEPSLQSLENYLSTIDPKSRGKYEGYLLKKGKGFSRGWTKHWFVLRNGILKQYERQTQDSEKSKELDIRLCAIHKIKNTKDEKGFIFEIRSPKKNHPWTLQAETEAERDEWLNAIQEAIKAGLLSQESTKKEEFVSPEEAFAQLRSVPGNDVCADCSEKDPTWSFTLFFLLTYKKGLHQFRDNYLH